MATRAERLPALRRLAVDPSATPAERDAAARFAAILEGPRHVNCRCSVDLPRYPLPSSSRPKRKAVVIVQSRARSPWLSWTCPSCGEGVSVPVDGEDVFKAAARVGMRDESRCCLCSPPFDPCDRLPIPDALRRAYLWRRTNEHIDLAFIELCRSLSRIAGQWCNEPRPTPRAMLRATIARTLDDATSGGVLGRSPKFQLRLCRDERLRVRWLAEDIYPDHL
jgi:hypothetical protein